MRTKILAKQAEFESDPQNAALFDHITNDREPAKSNKRGREATDETQKKGRKKKASEPKANQKRKEVCTFIYC